MLLVELALSAKADPDERVMITIALKLEKKGITKKLTQFSCYHDKQKYKGPREAPFGKVGSNNNDFVNGQSTLYIRFELYFYKL